MHHNERDTLLVEKVKMQQPAVSAAVTVIGHAPRKALVPLV
jgi:hypothetical protein